LLPYHTLGLGKYDWIGKEYQLKNLKAYNEQQINDLYNKIEKVNKKINFKVIK